MYFLCNIIPFIKKVHSIEYLAVVGVVVVFVVGTKPGQTYPYPFYPKYYGQIEVMPESLIVNYIVKHRRMMGLLTSLALSVSITGKSSLSSSSISLLCSAVSGKVAHILYSVLKPAGPSLHQLNQTANTKFIFLLSPPPPCQFTGLFVLWRKGKIFDQTSCHTVQPRGLASLKVSLKHLQI